MSKEVMIPTFMQPDFVCTINNVTYRYKAGTTQTVPDEVAELIANINAQEPVENPPETLEHEITRIATQIAEEKVAETYVIDLTQLTLSPGEAINLTDAGIITKDEFLAMTESGKDIYIRLNDGVSNWLWLMDSRREGGGRISTMKNLTEDAYGITLLLVSIYTSEEKVYGEANLGFAPNPYAGGGE